MKPDTSLLIDENDCGDDLSAINYDEIANFKLFSSLKMSKAVSRTEFEFNSESVVSSQNVLMPQFFLKTANRAGTSRIMGEITITS